MSNVVVTLWCFLGTPVLCREENERDLSRGRGRGKSDNDKVGEIITAWKIFDRVFP